MSDGRREEDLSAIAWPGFVDILSAVIIMFVFFVMVTAVALYMHTITYKSKVVQDIQQENVEQEQLTEFDSSAVQEQEELQQQNQSLSDKTKTLETTLEEVKKEKEALENVLARYEQELFQMRSEFTESKDQELIIDAAENSVLIFFGTDSISLTKESEEKLAAYLNDNYTDKSALTARIVAGKNPQTAIESVARKLSVARIFNLRNNLLAQEIPPAAISATMDNEQQYKDSHHWVKLYLSQ